MKVLMISFLVFLLIACDYTYKEKTTEQPKAAVYFTLGDVTINGLPVRTGQLLNQDDLIQTGSESLLEVKFGRQSGFSVREESEVVFNSTDEISLTVKKGKVLSMLEKNSNYSVRTPAAVAAVRGTIFFADVLNPDSVYFCACNGTIAIEDENKTKLKQLSSAHHEANFVEKENQQPVFHEAGMFEHTDLEIFQFMYRLDNAVKQDK